MTFHVAIRINTHRSGIANDGARGVNAELERPYRAAVTRFLEAQAHASAGDRATAAAAAADARAIALRIGATWVRDELDGLVVRARLQPAGSRDQEADGPADTEFEDPFGLTPRERQVLELIARGATNREIGAELFMAEKTASVHVSRS